MAVANLDLIATMSGKHRYLESELLDRRHHPGYSTIIFSWVARIGNQFFDTDVKNFHKSFLWALSDTSRCKRRAKDGRHAAISRFEILSIRKTDAALFAWCRSLPRDVQHGLGA